MKHANVTFAHHSLKTRLYKEHVFTAFFLTLLTSHNMFFVIKIICHLLSNRTSTTEGRDRKEKSEYCRIFLRKTDMV